MAFSIYTGDQRADILGSGRPDSALKTMVNGILSSFWKNPTRRPEAVILMAWQAEIKDIKNKIYDIKRLASQTKKKPNGKGAKSDTMDYINVIIPSVGKMMTMGPSLRMLNYNTGIGIGTNLSAQVYTAGRENRDVVKEELLWHFTRCVRLFAEASLATNAIGSEESNGHLNKCFNILDERGVEASTLSDADVEAHKWALRNAPDYEWASHYENAAHFISDIWQWGVRDCLNVITDKFDEYLTLLLQSGPDIPHVPHKGCVFSPPAAAGIEAYEGRITRLVAPLLVAFAKQNNGQEASERRLLLVEGLVEKGFGEEVIPPDLHPDCSPQPK